MANKFGIARVAGYFAKLWRACSQESKEDLWRYDVPFLLDLPDPEYALDEMEGIKIDLSK